MIQTKWNDIQTNLKLFLFLQNQNLSDEALQNSNTNHSSLSIIDMRLILKPLIWALCPLWTSVVWLKMEPGFKPSSIWVVQITTSLMQFFKTKTITLSSCSIPNWIKCFVFRALWRPKCTEEYYQHNTTFYFIQSQRAWSWNHKAVSCLIRRSLWALGEILLLWRVQQLLSLKIVN